jgi:hypothetical protein
MSFKLGEIAASDCQFAVAVESLRRPVRISPTKLAPSCPWSVRLYSVPERRPLVEIPIPEADSEVRLALTAAGVVAGSYYGRGLTLRTFTGELRWHRRDVKKVQSIALIQHAGQPERLGVRVERHTLLVLSVADGRTRHRLPSCTTFLAGPQGTALMLRSARGVWLADAATFSPTSCVLQEDAARAYASPAGFLVAWYGGYAGVDHTGSVMWRNETSNHTPGPAVWHASGCWLMVVRDVAPNRILSVRPDGNAEVLCELPFAQDCVFLSGGELLADSDGRMFNARNGTLEWTFDEEAARASAGPF